MTSLLAAVCIQPGDCVAVVGGGGKTTLCWRLAQEIATLGERVIFTTTTKIWQPAPGTFDFLGIHPDPLRLLDEANNVKTACLAAGVEGAICLAPVAGAGMPTVQTKLIGFTPETICALTSIVNRQSSIIIECDGARGLRIKAPAENEPVIPPCASVVCVLANLDAIGRPLDERIAHRVDHVARLTRTMPGSVITASLIVTLLAHPDGGLKGIPPYARKVAVLTQQYENTMHPAASQIIQALVRQGFDRAATIAPRATRPVLGVGTAPGVPPEGLTS